MAQDRHADPLPLPSTYEHEENITEPRISFNSYERNADDIAHDDDYCSGSSPMQPLMLDDRNGFNDKIPWTHYIKDTGHRLRVICAPNFPWTVRRTETSQIESRRAPVPKPTHSLTSWLDGLRGIACLMVVFYHSRIMFQPFTPPDAPSNTLFLKLRSFVNLPLIRLWAAGPAMVSIFFIVSGFSLSFSSLGHLRRGDHEKALQSLSSSTFRRWMRLNIPTLVVTFGDMLASYAGLYNGTAIGGRHRQPPKSDDFSIQFWDWWGFWRGLSNPFQAINPNSPAITWTPSYDPNVWTIPIEFHGSMVIFLVILATSRVRSNMRMLFLAGTVCLLLHDNELSLVLFLAGTLLAEIHHAREGWRDKIIGGIAPDLEPCSSSLLMTLSRTCKHKATENARFLIDTTAGQKILSIFWILNFIWGLYNISVGDEYLICISAMHIILAIDNSNSLQSIFKTRSARFLGKISFSLYLIHGAVLHTLGWHIWSAYTSNWTSSNTAWGHLTATTLAAIPTYAFAIILAYFLSWTVDDKSVQLAQWVWKKVKQ